MSARGEPPSKKRRHPSMTSAYGDDSEGKQFNLVDTHAKHAFRTLAEMWQREELCDLTLLVGGKSFHVHKALLSSCIPFLRAMLSSGMKESRQGEVRLHEVDEESMSAIVKFCYTGEIDITAETVHNLVAAANLLQMDDLRDICCQFMKVKLTPENCIYTRCFADVHGFQGLLRAADQYAFKNFENVVESEEFLQADISIVTQLLDSEIVQVPSEECIYNALVRWVKHDTTLRMKHALDLLRCVRFPSLSRDFIESTIIPGDIVKATPNCDAFFQGVLAAHIGPQTKVRMPPVAIYVVGGRNSTSCLDSCERYEPEKNRWSAIAPMSQVRTAVTIAQMNGYIYAIGGERETQFSHYGTSYLNSVERYSIKTDTWDLVAPLRYSRSFAASAVLNDRLYVIGGEDGGNYSMLSVEIFDPEKNEWTEGPSLNMRRSGPGCCVVDGCIYVLGGCTAAIENYHMSVEMLRPPASDTPNDSENSECHWTLGKSMELARSGVAVCTLDKRIYACGGRNRSQSIYYKAVECYDCEAKQWITISDMHMKRAWAGCVVCSDRILVFGGYDGIERLDSVESLDPVTKEWTIVDTKMAFQRAGCSAVVA